MGLTVENLVLDERFIRLLCDSRLNCPDNLDDDDEPCDRCLLGRCSMGAKKFTKPGTRVKVTVEILEEQSVYQKRGTPSNPYYIWKQEDRGLNAEIHN